jgi:hypothetical protein
MIRLGMPRAAMKLGLVSSELVAPVVLVDELVTPIVLEGFVSRLLVLVALDGVVGL